MRISIILILSLLLVSVSSAKQESLTMGPYKVSFDLNTTQEYSINNTIPVEYAETYGGISYVIYQTKINDSNNIAFITVNHFSSNQMNKDIDEMKSNIRDVLSNSPYYDCDTYDRIIDGKSGVLGVGENYEGDSNWFLAEYWPMFNMSSDTKVSINSYYPWYDGTLSLLKTIHVEMEGKPPI